MIGHANAPFLETKFQPFGEGLELKDCIVAGYASLFGSTDQGGDTVMRGAYTGSLRKRAHEGQSVKMLWQHDPARPIGVWDEIREDERGLFVRGRILSDVQDGREALALIEAGAIDGLSIGYRTVRSEKAAQGRALLEIDLWEVSVVTFPMLPEARVAPEQDSDEALARDLADAFAAARAMLA